MDKILKFLENWNYQSSLKKTLILIDLIVIKEIEFLTKSISTEETLASNDFTDEFCQIFKEEIIPIL
jgi:hypothetical protein